MRIVFNISLIRHCEIQINGDFKDLILFVVLGVTWELLEMIYTKQSKIE